MRAVDYQNIPFFYKTASLFENSPEDNFDGSFANLAIRSVFSNNFSPQIPCGLKFFSNTWCCLFRKTVRKAFVGSGKANARNNVFHGDV